MFWRFGGYANISTIDSILEKPDVTLEELLEEPDLIQELKSQNAKLIEYLREDAVLERLLQYVVAPEPAEKERPVSPPEKSTGGFFGKSRSKTRSQSQEENESEHEKQEQKRLNYAFISCEILSAEVWSIVEALVDNVDHLCTFWDFLKRPAPLNPKQAGYFTKVNESLMEKKPAEMIQIVKALDDVIPKMMKHVDCPMIMDLLLKLISLDKSVPDEAVVDWIQAQGLIPILLSFISPEKSAVTQTSAGDFLKAIITISANATGQDSSVIGPNELTRQLVSATCMQTLVSEMLKGGSPLAVGVGIVIEVIRKNNSDYDSETNLGPEPKSSDPIYLGTLLGIFADHIQDFMALMQSPGAKAGQTDAKNRRELKTAWGDKIEPLGFDRFKTCELMAELLHCSNMGLLNEKGSEIEMKQKDAERERLKAEGKLTAAKSQDQQGSNEFGSSVDSQGFHHAEAFSPLGESPENIRNVEEDFEKVDVDPDAASAEKGSQNILAKEIDEINLNATGPGSPKAVEEKTHSPSSPTSPSKRYFSLLTEQLQGQKTPPLSPTADPSTNFATLNSSDDAPAPLFSKRHSRGRLSKELAQPSPSGEGAANESSDTEKHTTEEEDYVVGDVLKIKFVEHRVVPTILDFFFRFPWNNFLHNVVYDVVQQVFNGPMDRGYNKYVAVDLFETGKITERIVEGQQRSDRLQQEKRMRLGYMGHLTLIAEEVVKLTERQPSEFLTQEAVEMLMHPDWVYYVEKTLTETRERDNAILGGVRPDSTLGPRQTVLNSLASQGFGDNTSTVLANAGLSGGSTGLDSMDLANAADNGFNITGNSLLSGFGSSDDEEDDDLEDNEDRIGNVLRSGDMDEEDQPEDHSDEGQDGHQPPLPPSSNSTIPAPLALAPSRARRQLAARLAEKKRLASSLPPLSISDKSEGQTEVLSPNSAAVHNALTGGSVAPQENAKEFAKMALATTGGAAALAPVSEVAKKKRKQASGDDDQGSSQDEWEGNEDDAEGDKHSSEDETDSDEAGENEDYGRTLLAAAQQQRLRKQQQQQQQQQEQQQRSPTRVQGNQSSSDEEVPDLPARPRPRRQTTHEAAERRPIELDGESEEDEDSSETNAKASEDFDGEKGYPVVKSRTTGVLRTTTTMPQKESKRLEQEKLLRRWGLSDEGEEDDGEGGGQDSDEESTDSDEQRPVEIGTKYLPRNSSFTALGGSNASRS